MPRCSTVAPHSARLAARTSTRRAPSIRCRNLLRHLIDGARRVDVLAAKRAECGATVEQRGIVVRGRIAEIDGHRVTVVLLENRNQSLLDCGERVFPSD